jgi:hypothetical protein
LTVGDLSDNWAGRGGLGLPIGDLGDTSAGARAVHDCLNVDGYALSTSRCAVQVVEVAGQALVEEGRAHQGHRAVATETETFSLLSTRLNGVVKLEPEEG